MSRGGESVLVSGWDVGRVVGGVEEVEAVAVGIMVRRCGRVWAGWTNEVSSAIGHSAPSTTTKVESIF